MPDRRGKAHAVKVQEALARDAEGRRVVVLRADKYGGNTYAPPLAPHGLFRYHVVRKGSGEAVHELRYGERRS